MNHREDENLTFSRVTYHENHAVITLFGPKTLADGSGVGVEEDRVVYYKDIPSEDRRIFNMVNAFLELKAALEDALMTTPDDVNQRRLYLYRRNYTEERARRLLGEGKAESE